MLEVKANQDVIVNLLLECVSDCEIDLKNYESQNFEVEQKNPILLRNRKRLSGEEFVSSIQAVMKRAKDVIAAANKQADEHCTLKQWIFAKFSLAERCRSNTDLASLVLHERIQNFDQDVTELSQKNVYTQTQHTHISLTNALSTNAVVDNGICSVFEKGSNLLQTNAVVCDRMLRLKILNDTNISRTSFDCVSFKLKRLNVWSCKVVYLLCLMIRFRVNHVSMPCDVPPDRLNGCCQSNIILRYFPRDGGGILFQWLPGFAVVLRF